MWATTPDRLDTSCISATSPARRTWLVWPLPLVLAGLAAAAASVPHAAAQPPIRKPVYLDARGQKLGDTPGEAASFRSVQQQGGPTRSAPDALPKALKQMNQLRTKAGLVAKVAGLPVGPQVLAKDLLPLTKALDRESWVWLGPGNIGGRTRAMLIHPAKPNLMWAAAAGGGVWMTRDGGASWQPTDDFLASLAVCCLAMHPRDPNTIFAGTGEGFLNADSVRGAGVFLTTDGGQTWKQLPATARPEFHYVNRLAMTVDGAALLAATNTGLYRSPDGGATWQPVKFPVPVRGGILDVDCNPTNPALCIAGAHENLAFVSTDGGHSWSAAKGLPPLAGTDSGWGRVELTYARANPAVVYASVGKEGGQLFCSTDGGQTYTLRDAKTKHLATQGWYANTLWAGDPKNADLVVVGGLDLWRSTDGGRSFAQISDWRRSPPSAHADHHFIVEHPRYDGDSNQTVFFGNDGGIYRADHVTTVTSLDGWRLLNHNYGVTQFYGAAACTKTGTIFAGTQDNGTLRFTRAGGPQRWDMVASGDGGFCAIDPTDPTISYGEHQYLGVFRLRKGGQYTPLYEGVADSGKNNDTLFIAPILLDPNNPSTLLAGGRRLWRTTDAKADKPQWAAIKPGLETSPPSRFDCISTLAVARGNSDVMWVGHANGRVFKTINGTAAEPLWIPVGLDGSSLPKRWCSSIAIDPRASEHVFLTFTGYHSGNVWETADGGQTWRNLGIDLPAAPVRCLVLHPRDSKRLYIGTEVGVFSSDDGGKTWAPTNEGPTSCSVDQLLWMNDTLIAVTHGRGLFEIRVP